MQFKSYLSALFYLTEASKYLEGNLKNQNDQQLSNLLNQGYEELGYVGFKVFNDLKLIFPELRFYSAKGAFAKTSARFILSKEFTRDNTPFPIQNEYNNNFTISQPLFSGAVDLNVEDYSSQSSRDPEDFYASRRVVINLNKFKTFSAEDFNILVNELSKVY